jgi:hypothetical protein
MMAAQDLQSGAMRMINPFAWFMGEVRRERVESRARNKARVAKRLEHPWRFGVIAAVVWGTTMWLLTMRSFDLFTLVTLPIYSAAVAALGVWSMRRSQRKWASERGRLEGAPPHS